MLSLALAFLSQGDFLFLMSYVPPSKRIAIKEDPEDIEYQRQQWEELKKSMNGLINKLNTKNITEMVVSLIQLNLTRGCGLFCKSIMKSQQMAPLYTPVCACCVAILNSKFPFLGELLVNRLIVQFRKSYKRQQKSLCLASLSFIVHLTHQNVVHELLLLQIMYLLIESPTNDSLELLVHTLKESGEYLSENSPKPLSIVFDKLRLLLQSSTLELRTQYMIETLFEIRKTSFKDYPSIVNELDLVEQEDQITHEINLDDSVEVKEELNIFKFDPHYTHNNDAYEAIKLEILGEETSEEEQEENLEQEEPQSLDIIDKTGQELVNIRKSVYLTIKSSLGYAECTHKLLKLNISQTYKSELPSMLVDCCSDEKVYNKFYAQVGTRLCQLNPYWATLFEKHFQHVYDIAETLEASPLRNCACFNAHLLCEKAISWSIFKIVYLSEKKTSSSTRVLLKFLLEAMHLTLKDAMKAEFFDKDHLNDIKGLFPKRNVNEARFAVNYWTSLKMGFMTDELRQWIKDQ